MKLQHKIAIVTGAGGGIGRATAIRFAAEGASVIAADVSEEGVNETARLISESGGTALACVGDVSQRDGAQAIVDAAVNTYGRVDVLVNNAGITRDGLTVRIKDGEVKAMSDDQWDSVLNVNLKGTWLMAQAAAVPMIKQNSGRIINTASVAALGNVGQANYSASKAGVIGLTHTLALEWARYHILVNCVAPGGVKTKMTDAIPEKVMEGIIQRIPLARFADPGEIAGVHTFLASDDSSFITGQVIFVDGGASVGA
ncbi:MAG: 3-oxoacyl-ACP reductase FabG [bacterium]|nr:3-oxoacyl-ACP reductase FabG [bacterium]